jgi:hypothetical protein
MAGSVMTFTETRHGSVKRIKAAWTSDDTTGAVEGTTTYAYSGQCLMLVTDPGATAPTDNYDIVIADDDAVDVLAGGGVNRDTANTETVLAAALGACAGSKLTFAVANAGNSKVGTIWLYIR